MELPLLANKRSSSHAAGTSGVPPASDVGGTPGECLKLPKPEVADAGRPFSISNRHVLQQRSEVCFLGADRRIFGGLKIGEKVLYKATKTYQRVGVDRVTM